MSVVGRAGEAKVSAGEGRTDEALGELKAALDDMARELAEVRQRLERLEAAAEAGLKGLPAESPVGPAVATAAGADLGLGAPAGILPLLGRSLVVLGGAYLLRALTDARLVPELWGTIAGLLYSAAWVVLADRAAARGRTVGAAFHGVTGLLIVHPLLWEATARFGLLAPGVSAALLLAFFALGLFVARRRALDAVATAAVLLGVTTALGLLVRTHELVVFTALLLLMAVIVEGLAAQDLWPGLRWVVAFAFDLAMLVLVMVGQRPGGPPEGYPALSAPAVLLLGLGASLVYLAGLSLRACARREPVGAFEVVQVPLALLLGFGGAALATAAHGGSLLPLGALGLGMGAAAYATAFAFLERRLESGRNFYVFSTLGIALVLVGARMVWEGTPLVLVLCAFMAAAAVLGAGFLRMTLRVHSVLVFLVAGVASGLFAHAAGGWLGAAGGPWPPLTRAGGAVLMTGAFSYAVLARARARATADAVKRVPPLVGAIALFWSACGAGLVWLAGLLGAPGPDADAAGLAALRTGVIAAGALGLAWSGGRGRLRELSWLVYPLLGLGAVKLLVEDLPQGRPLTLFLAFALYGGALIAVPRLLRTETS